jgi:hypothetical protein
VSGFSRTVVKESTDADESRVATTDPILRSRALYGGRRSAAG